MEERVRNVELAVAVMKSEMASLKEAVEKNTAAQREVALALASLKGGKAVLVSIAIGATSLVGLLISWFKGS